MQLTSFLTIAMATASAALPSVARARRDAPFKLQMSWNANDKAPRKNVTLTAIMDPDWKYVYLVAEDPAVSAGTPAVMYTRDDDLNEAALALSIDGVDYGLDVPDIGDQQDVADPIMARPGYLEYEFSVVGDHVYHHLSAGSNMWLACNLTFNGQVKPVLAWGAYSVGLRPPIGCNATSVYKINDVDV